MSRLEDLKSVIEICRDRIAEHDPNAPIRIQPDLWARIRDAYRKRSRQSVAELIGDHTIKITTSSDKKLFISAQELPQIWGTIPYARAAIKYERTVDNLAVEKFRFANRGADAAKRIFKNLPSPDWLVILDAADREKIEEFLEEEFADPEDRERFRKFLGSKGGDGWSGVSKELSRTDWLASAIPAVGEWLAVGAAGRGDLVLALAEDPEIEKGLEAAIISAEKASAAKSEASSAPPPSTEKRVTGGENALFYGAPGTGKSYDIWQVIDKAADPHFVTVFHPDMQNSDFAGTLKPGLNDKGKVTYAFRPGPFANAVARAWANPDKKVYLVIEELNRAVAAAVFGELFQLLDRNPDGSSCYEVDFPSPEFETWFRKAAQSDAERLALPSNLWILATMNSADQGVYPLDTAFRRRWRQHYLAIDYKKAADTEIKYVRGSAKQTIEWRHFVQALNGFLVSDLQIDEDRLIGPRFVDEQDLQDGQLPGKLLIYLWDDLLRHHQDKALFDNSVRTYGDLDRRMSQDQQIFSDGFLALLEKEESEESASDLNGDPA